MLGKGDTARPATAGTGIKTPFTAAADTLLVTQTAEDLAVLVQLF
jgi:hypothetical protein